MPESIGTSVSATADPNPGQQAPLAPTIAITTSSFEALCADHAKLQTENATLRGKINAQGGEKRLLILFVVILILLLFGRTFAPLILKSKQDADTSN